MGTYWLNLNVLESLKMAFEIPCCRPRDNAFKTSVYLCEIIRLKESTEVDWVEAHVFLIH